MERPFVQEELVGGTAVHQGRKGGDGLADALGVGASPPWTESAASASPDPYATARWRSPRTEGRFPGGAPSGVSPGNTAGETPATAARQSGPKRSDRERRRPPRGSVTFPRRSGEVRFGERPVRLREMPGELVSDQGLPPPATNYFGAKADLFLRRGAGDPRCFRRHAPVPRVRFGDHRASAADARRPAACRPLTVGRTRRAARRVPARGTSCGLGAVRLPGRFEPVAP